MSLPYSLYACYGVYVMTADVEWESVCQLQCFVLYCCSWFLEIAIQAGTKYSKSGWMYDR